MAYPSKAWQRAAYKWPVNLWRLGLAPIIGHHMILISHTGRKTGQVRRTMTEYYRLDGRKYAPCAFGEQAQWYRNIVADPLVTIQTAAGAESVIAHRVSDDWELLALIDAVRRRSRLILDLYLESLDIQNDNEDILAKKELIYWIRFDETEQETPPPMEADLVWLWPIMVFGIGVLAYFKARRS